MADQQLHGLMSNVVRLDPAQRADGRALHRPLLLLWAIGQSVNGEPRLQRWSDISRQLGELLTRFAGVHDQRAGALYPFWALRRDGLWEVTDADRLTLTSAGRRPTLGALDEANPSAGLPAASHDLLRANPALAARVAAILIVKFFNPIPDGLFDAVGLSHLLADRIPDALRPRLGERFANRDAIWATYGGQKVMGIGAVADGILSVFSKDQGPYVDGRIPGTDWIAYTGDGLSGDQTLIKGNKALAAYQAARRPLRYWHKPYGAPWSFESWVVVIERRRRWGVGNDGAWRREYVWVLAPVPSPLRDTWPQEVLDALDDDTGETHDDAIDVVPAGAPTRQEQETDPARYARLCQAAERTASNRARTSQQVQTERYLRSPAARDAVLLRSGGRCENPQCMGHSTELTDAGRPILEVDHINDIARGGPDHPKGMIALCPNCHALKTRGVHRTELRRVLLKTALARHRTFSQPGLSP